MSFYLSILTPAISICFVCTENSSTLCCLVVANLFKFNIDFNVCTLLGDLDRALKQKRAKPEALEEVVLPIFISFVHFA